MLVISIFLYFILEPHVFHFYNMLSCCKEYILLIFHEEVGMFWEIWVKSPSFTIYITILKLNRKPCIQPPFSLNQNTVIGLHLSAHIPYLENGELTTLASQKTNSYGGVGRPYGPPERGYPHVLRVTCDM